MLKIKYYLLTVIIISNFAFGQTNQWQVLWDLNSEPDMFQYWVYRGTSQDPTNRIATVNHDNDSYIDNQLTKGVRYYYRITAVDYSANESGYSVNVSAALPKIDFSTLPTQYIAPGQTISISNLGIYVTDPDDNSHTWTANVSSLTISFSNQRATITAPEGFSSAVTAQFTATDSDGFYDISSITFNMDTSTTPSTPETEVFAYPTPINLADDPNAKITFQNVPDKATVLIYNMLGELVYKVEDVPYEWDIKNESGKAIYPGVYLYYVKSGGKKRTGKLVIVK